MIDEELKQSFAHDIVLMKLWNNPIIIHGGGPQINELLDKLRFNQNYRRDPCDR